MNIFKKLKAAIFGTGNRKKVNIEAVNKIPPVDNNLNVSSSFGRGSRWQGYKGQSAAQKRTAALNAWRNGGTHSWAKGKKGRLFGSQPPAATLIEKQQRRLTRLNKHLDSVTLQVKNKSVMNVGR